MALGAIPIVLVGALLIFDRFSVLNRTRSVSEAWGLGVIQGFLALNLALLVITIGIAKTHHWARWATVAWGPVLALNAVFTELWHLKTVTGGTLFEGVTVATVWVWLAYRQLFTAEVSHLFAKTSDI